jgi:hypothetical protein
MLDHYRPANNFLAQSCPCPRLINDVIRVRNEDAWRYEHIVLDLHRQAGVALEVVQNRAVRPYADFRLHRPP